MKNRIIFPILGLFLLATGFTGFLIYHNGVFDENDVPDLPTEKVNLVLDFESTQTLALGLEPQDPTWFTQEGAEYMRTYLLEPSEKLNSFVDEDMMSRCGSGANYILKGSPTEEVPYYLGEVNLNQGCANHKTFFDFRVSPDGLILELSDPGKSEYSPYKEWFKTAKPIL